MHLYFKNNLTSNSSSRSNQCHFEVNVKISEAKSIEKRLFFLDPYKNHKYNNFFGHKICA